MSECRCDRLSRLDGTQARTYADDHLRLVERGRDSNEAEDYVCVETEAAWVMDFPMRHWAEDAGAPRLRRLPLDPSDPPIGALD